MKLSYLMLLLFIYLGNSVLFLEGAHARARSKSSSSKRAGVKAKQSTQARVAFCKASVSSSQTAADTSEVAQQCSGKDQHKNVRTFSCIHWVAQQAEKAFARDGSCQGRVTAPLLMCIFKREVGRYSNNPCVSNGCGLSQFTTAGVSYVKQAFSRGLADDYDYFWDLVGRPNEKSNKCALTRRHALDRDTAVVMAATHLCGQVKSEGQRSTFLMAQRYNGHPRYKNAYGRFVDGCVKRGLWKTNGPAQEVKVGLKSECRGFKSCGGRKLSSAKKKSQSSSKKGHGSRGVR